MPVRKFTGALDPPPTIKPFEGFTDQEEETASASLGDVVKSFGAGALTGLGGIMQGGGDVLARAANAAAGRFGLEPELRSVNPLQPLIEGIEGSYTPKGKVAMALSQPSGDVLSPSTWSLGEKPKPSGFAANVAGVLGQFAPMYAQALASGGLSVPAQFALGATTGGLQAHGLVQEEERERILQMKPEELAKVPYYNQLLSEGIEPSRARDIVADRVGLFGGIGSGVPSALEGAFENILIPAILRGRVRLPATLAKGRAGRAITGGIGGFGIGGTEETIEKIGQTLGANIAGGEGRKLTAETFPEALMGGLAEGTAGGALGALSSGRTREREPTPPHPLIPPTHDETLRRASEIALRGQAAATVPEAPTTQEAPTDEAGEGAGAIGETPAPVTYPRELEALQTLAPREGQPLDKQFLTDEDRSFLLQQGYAVERPERGQKALEILPAGRRRLTEIQPVDEAAHEAAASPTNERPEPTPGQAEAGNYKMGPIRVGGVQISIENPEGSVRKDMKNLRPKWQRTMRDHYGYIKGVPARAPDKDRVDVFVKPGTTGDFGGDVFVVDQYRKNGKFDEPKVMVGYGDEREATQAYLRNYQRGWSGGQGITRLSMDEFKTRLQDPRGFESPMGTRLEGGIRSLLTTGGKREGEDQARVSAEIEGRQPQPVQAQPEQKGGGEAGAPSGVLQAPPAIAEPRPVKAEGVDYARFADQGWDFKTTFPKPHPESRYAEDGEIPEAVAAMHDEIRKDIVAKSAEANYLDLALNEGKAGGRPLTEKKRAEFKKRQASLEEELEGFSSEYEQAFGTQAAAAFVGPAHIEGNGLGMRRFTEENGPLTEQEEEEAPTPAKPEKDLGQRKREAIERWNKEHAGTSMVSPFKQVEDLNAEILRRRARGFQVRDEENEWKLFKEGKPVYTLGPVLDESGNLKDISPARIAEVGKIAQAEAQAPERKPPTEKERIERERTNIYNDITKAIADAEAAGNEEQASALRHSIMSARGPWSLTKAREALARWNKIKAAPPAAAAAEVAPQEELSTNARIDNTVRQAIERWHKSNKNPMYASEVEHSVKLWSEVQASRIPRTGINVFSDRQVANHIQRMLKEGVIVEREGGYDLPEGQAPSGETPIAAAVGEAFGEKNTVFTKDAAEAARERLRKKMGTLRAGIDPEMMQDGITLAGYYIEGGARKFADYAAKMVADLGEGIRPYLKSFYVAVRNWPGFDTTGMSTDEEIDAALAPAPEPVAMPEREQYIPGPIPRHIRDLIAKRGANPDEIVIITSREQYREFQGRYGLPNQLPAVDGGLQVGRGNAMFVDDEQDGKPVAVALVAPADMGGETAPSEAPIETPPQPAQTEVEETTDERPAATGESAEALGEVAPAEGGGLEGGGGVSGGLPRGGGVGAEGDRGVGAEGLPSPRSGGGRAEEPYTPPARTRRRTGRLGARGARAERAGVPEPGVVPEAPNVPGVNYRITDEVELGLGSEGVKFRDNIDAIRTLKQIEAENRRATPDEQRTLARYVGWGGLANAFADNEGNFKDGWADRGGELAEILTPTELAAARRTTRNAHYTSELIVDGIWDAVSRMGFKGGLVLESSMGTGNFLGLMPEDILGTTKVIGVEYDGITSRIAKMLYPQSTVLQSGFQKVPVPDGEFDLNIGNPPFGSESLTFQFKPELKGHSIHNQFFLAGMDALKPGGIQAMVVSRYLMDGQDASARLEMARKAKLVGAIRLPDTAFKENARTEVVTDILFFQKLSGSERSAMEMAVDARQGKLRAKSVSDKYELRRLARQVPSWVDTTQVSDPLGGEPMTVNEYFADNENMILGRLERSGKLYGKEEINVKLQEGQDLETLLDEALARLPENIAGQEPSAIERSIERFQSMSDGLKIAISGQESGSMEVEDGRLNQIYERETPTGAYELAKREISPDSPWSQQLLLDADGKWYTLETQLDEKGKPVKKGRRNVYERKVFQNESEIPASLRLGEARFTRLKSLVELRDLLKKQIVLESEDAPSSEMEANRKDLAKAYKAFVDRNGLINIPSNANLVSEMPDGALVLALELNYRPEISDAASKRMGEQPRAATADPAPIMSNRVVVPYVPPNTAASPEDALAISLSETGKVDLPRMSELLDMTEGEVIKRVHNDRENPLIFRDPETETWVTANEYLSGQVKRKLQAAAALGMDKNVAALEKVQPEAWTADQVTAIVGSTWVPEAIYADFVQHITGQKAIVRFQHLTNSFMVHGKVGAEQAAQWNTEGMDVVTMLSNLLNSKAIRITYEDADGRRHLDQERTALAQLKAKQLEAEFSDWIFQDNDRRARLVELFNEKFNTRVTRQNDGSHLTLPGKVPDAIIKMRRHQKNAIWRGIIDRFVLYDHVVGSGKTFTIIARAMERRRMGLSRKPTIVVPNHLVEQFTSDAYRLYPGAKVLAASKKDFERKRRRRLFAKIATGDWDMVIMPHSSFGFIDIAPETEERYLTEEIRIAEQAIKDAWEQAQEDGLAQGGRKPFNVKEAERLAEKLQNRMDALKKRQKDRLLTFEQMGIDDLTIDEAHEYKNLFYSSRLTNVRGMNDKVGSQKAYDLYNKIRVLRDSPTGSVVFSTGTPISNSAVEMYQMMRYLSANELRDLGLEHFDAWRAQFVDASTKWEPTESGRLKEVNRLGRTWSNMRHLMEQYYSFTDAVAQEDIEKWYAEDNNGAPFPVPKIKGGERQSVVVKPTAAQRGALQAIIEGFDGLPEIRDPNERNAERLRLMDRARKVSLDIRALDPGNSSKEDGGKLDVASQRIAEIYRKWDKDRGTQLVFLDRSVPRAKQDKAILKEYDAIVAERDKALAEDNDEAYRLANEKLDRFDSDEIRSLREAQVGGWNGYQELKNRLIAQGVKSNEIRFIQEANNDQQKQAMFDAINAGEIRVLIGSTPRMGAGTNAQRRLVALHHIDVTWKPSDIEQREGRIIRQGNSLLEKYGDNFEVEILAYATERTVDAKLWDVNATKLKTINGIRKYRGEFTMEFEDEDAVSMAEIAALASGDPLLLERVKLASDIDRILLMKRAFQRRQFGLKDQIAAREREVRDYPQRVEEVKRTATILNERLEPLEERAAARRVTVDGTEYGSRFEAAKAAKAAIETQQAGNEKARWSLTVNGEQITNQEALQQALASALGDESAFEMEIDGRTFIRRDLASREIRLKAAELLGELGDQGRGTRHAEVGTLAGLPVTIDVSRHSGNWMTLDLTLEDEGGKRLVSTLGRQTEDITGAQFSPQYVRSNLDQFVKEVFAAREPYTAFFEDKIKEAEQALPKLREQLTDTFPQEGELAQKEERLKQIISELAAKGETKQIETEVQEGDDGAPPAAMRLTSYRNKSNVPLFGNDQILLARPKLGSQRGPILYTLLDTKLYREAQENPKINPVDYARVGDVEVDVENGQITGLSGLFIDKHLQTPTRAATGEQRMGYGERVVRAIIESAPDNAKITIYNVLPEARGFWDKMGVEYERSPIGFDNAILTKTGYERSRGPIAGGLPSLVFQRGGRAAQPEAEPVEGESASAGRRRAFEEARAAKVAQVRSKIDDLTRGWTNKPETIVTNTIAEWGIWAPEDSLGLYYRGKMYVAADHVTSERVINRVVFHEILGHHGLRTLLGSGSEAIATLNHLWSINPSLRRQSAEWLENNKDIIEGRKLSPQVAKALAIEESLVSIVETGAEINGFQRMLNRIQKWLREHGMSEIANWLEERTDAEVMDMIAQARAHVMDGPQYVFDPERTAPPAANMREGQISDAVRQALQVGGDIFRSDRKLNRLISKFNTPYHIAQVHPSFNPVYEEAQAFNNDVSRIALESADNAPTLLPRVESFKDYVKIPVSREDIEAVAAALYSGTLYGGGNPREGVIWTDEELTGGEHIGRPNTIGRNLTPEQIRLYHEALSAVAHAVDENAKSLIWRLSQRHGLQPDRELNLQDMAESARQRIDDAIDEREAEIEVITDPVFLSDTSQNIIERAGDPRVGEIEAANFRKRMKNRADALQAQIDELNGVRQQFNDIEEKAVALREHGYFPAMRFGEYFVNVSRQDARGNREELYFGRFRTQPEANEAKRQLQREYPDADITSGLMNTQAHRLFQGLNLDALELFAEHVKDENGTAIAEDPIMQAYFRLAASERSALKRHLHRKGVPGYDDDVTRTLSQMIVATARSSSSNYHGTSMLRHVQAIKAGDLQRYATDFVRYLQDPQEESPRLRGFLANYYILGSLAFGAINLTQPALSTFPYLTQYTGAPDAMGKVIGAVKSMMEGRETLQGEEREAFNRAVDEGIVSPQEIHQLRAESRGTLIGGKNLAWRKFMHGWGAIYSITEQFNRGTSFLAAYRIAREQNIPNPYDFAKQAVSATQFIYNRSNRPEISRGPIGSVVMTFKQFSISYIELGVRLYNRKGPDGRPDRKAFAFMMLTLMVLAGIQGLPFAEDAEDVIDGVGQALGYTTNTRKQLRDLVISLLGEDIGEVMMQGLSGIPAFPIDVSNRLGMQNLIPGTALLKASEPDKTRDIVQILGPAGTLFKDMGQAVQQVMAGQPARVEVFLPKSIQHFIKGLEMANTGIYKDSRGRRVMDVTGLDAAWKMIGFQPSRVARESEKINLAYQDVALHKVIEDGIASKWARGIFENDPEKIEEARRALIDWNATNPELPVRITGEQIARRVAEMRKTRSQRFQRSAPPEIRRKVTADLAA